MEETSPLSLSLIKKAGPSLLFRSWQKRKKSKMLVKINEEGTGEEDDFSSCCSVEEEKS
jgi:hypothetical protein